jgi:hypothetical protein
MFTFNGPDTHHILTTLRLHLPVKMAVVEILPECEKTDVGTSTKGVRAPHSENLEGSLTLSLTESPTQSHLVDAETMIPMICISTKSWREKTATAAKVNSEEDVNGETMRHENEQPCNLLIDTKGKFIRISRLNEISGKS